MRNQFMSLSLATFSAVLFLTTQAHAEKMVVKCGDKELSFKIEIENELPTKIKFSKRGGGTNLSNDLLGGEAKLFQSRDYPSTNERVYFVGEVKLLDYYSFERTVQVEYKRKELQKDKDIIIDMHPGDAHIQGDESTTFAMWSYSCEKI